MKYLCLAYYDEAKFNALPKPQLDQLIEACRSRDQALRDSGQLTLVASLAEPKSASILRPHDRSTRITDGPFSETKEQLGAFFIIEARDLNDAIRVASKHPAAQLGEQVGWCVEVRAIEMFEQLGDT